MCSESATCAAQTPKHQLSTSENRVSDPPMGISASLHPTAPPTWGRRLLTAWDKASPSVIRGWDLGTNVVQTSQHRKPCPLVHPPLELWRLEAKVLGMQNQVALGEKEAWPGQTAAPEEPCVGPGRPRVQGGSASRGLIDHAVRSGYILIICF